MSNLSPLTRAVLDGDLPAVMRRLAAGDDPDERTVQGFTTLMVAAKEGRAEICRALLLAGADLEARTPPDSAFPDQTALSLAAWFPKLSSERAGAVVACLLAHGARVSPAILRAAREAGREDLASQLEAASTGSEREASWCAQEESNPQPSDP